LKAAAAIGAAAFVASPDELFGVLRSPGPGFDHEVIAHAVDGRRIDQVRTLERAWELGAHGVDVDVRSSKDGVLFVWHDSTLLSHPQQVTGRVESSSAGRLDELGLLRLSAAQAACPADRFLVWDVKDSLPAAMAVLEQEIERYGSRGNKLWVGDLALVRRIQARFPLLEAGLLRDTASVADSRGYVRQAAFAGARAVSLHPDGLSPAVVRLAHRQGLRVYCYARTEAQRRESIAAGVDGFVTDDLAAPELAIFTKLS
jgi:glycerophosphoryl diester phosphodiesterase